MKKFVKMLSISLLSLSMLGGLSTYAEEKKDLKGEIEFYTSQPDADAAKLVESFNKKYPEVKVNIFRSGTEEVMSKLKAEKESGKVMADVLLLADAVTFESLKKDDMLLKYKSKEAEKIKADYVDKDEMYTGTKIMTTGIIYNTELVKEAPKSWKDLTGEGAKEKLVMPNPLYSGAAAYNLGIFTRTKGFEWKFYEDLKANKPQVVKGNGGVMDAVSNGQASYGMVVDYLAFRAKNNGSPVDFVYPEEGVPVITEPVAIIKTTEEADLAQAFVDFILSEEGQMLQKELGYAPIRDGVEGPLGLKTAKDLDKILTSDMKELLENREADKAKFDEIFSAQ